MLDWNESFSHWIEGELSLEAFGLKLNWSTSEGERDESSAKNKVNILEDSKERSSGRNWQVQK